MATYDTAIAQNACYNWPLGAGFAKRTADAGDHHLGSIAQKVAADPDDQPAQRSKFGVSIDVGSALRGICPMLGAIEFDRNFEFAISHVQPRERIAIAVRYKDLRLGFRQFRTHQQKSRSGFLRRLRSAVHQPEDLSQLHYAPHTRVTQRQPFDVGLVEVGRIRQRINTNQRRGQTFATTEIEGGPGRRGDGYPASHAHFVFCQFVSVDDYSVCRLAVSPIDLGRQSWVDPLRIMLRGRRKTR